MLLERVGRMRRKKKKIIKLFLLLILLILIGTIIYLIFFKTKEDIGSKKEYSDKSISVINQNKLENIYKNKYSKTLDEILKNDLFRNEYLDEYQNIDYIDESFLKNINKYLEKGYKADEVNNITKLSKKNQEKLLDLEKTNFEKFIDIKNYDANKTDRYNSYMEKTNKDINTAVTHVNIGLDKDFYEDTTKVENPDDVTALINKYHYVDKDFVPKDLVVLFDSRQNAKMTRVAAEAYKEFIEGSKKDGLTLESTTAYRSYNFQNALYTNYVRQDGVKKADTYSARPGTSEHQLGLAVDLNDPNVSGARLNEKDGKWVRENAHKYGFILRYLEEFVPVTGYMYEPWHIRYLGKDLATKVYESGLTYDEYYDLYLTEY